MLRFGRRLGVAVSGGADSVCLLRLLASLSAELGVRLTVLHVNHGLRGVESDGDARFVAALAESLNLAAVEQRLDPIRLRKGNLEQNARLERLRLFRQWKAELDLDAIALGHTRTDQAETVLMRLIRGAGPAGLAGIRPVTADGRIRPLIEVSSQQVRRWLSERSLPWREDSSNHVLDRTRNRVRSTILPALAAENPRVEASLARCAGLARLDELHWAPLVEEALERVAVDEKGSMILDANAVASMEPALASRVLQAAAGRVRGRIACLDLYHLEELYRLAAHRRDGMVQFGGLTAMRSFDRLRLSGTSAGAAAGFSQQIDGPGEFGADGIGLRIRLERAGGGEIRPSQEFSPGCRYNGGRHWLDGDRIAFPLVLRVWKPGDRYQPLGARREYSLHELFQRERIPRWERDCWPVIVACGRVVWARRFGAAEWAAAAFRLASGLEVREVGSGEQN